MNLGVENAVADVKSRAQECQIETRLTEEEAEFLSAEAKRPIPGSDVIAIVKKKFGKTISSATVSRYRLMKTLQWSRAGRKKILGPTEEETLLTETRQWHHRERQIHRQQ